MWIPQRPRIWQPQDGAGIAWGNPITRGLAFLAPMGPVEGLRDLVSGSRATATGLATKQPNALGLYPLFGTSNYADFDAALPALSGINGTTPLTIAWTQEPRSTSGYSTILNWKPAGATYAFLIYQSSSDVNYYFAAGPRNSGVMEWNSDVGAATNGAVDRFVLTVGVGTDSSGLTSNALYRNGRLLTAGAGTNFGANTTASFRVGALDSAGDPFEGLIGNLHIWKRVLSAAEAREWGRNPFITRSVLPRRIWVAAAGTSHATSGALASDAAIIAGTATHLTLHATSGALASAAAAIAGAATHSALHSTSGALAAAAAAIAGTATHLTLHTASGALAADTAVIAGSADHTTPGGTTHTTTGALAADAAVIAGTAAHLTLHTTSGALSAGVAAIAGTSAHLTLHTTSGALQADSANISGVAQNGLFVPSTNRGAGSPSKTRKPRKRRFTVTVDGEDFQVSSVEEAQEILAKVRESAEEQAEVVTQRAKAVSNRPQRKVLADARKSLAVPSIKVPADMRPAAEALRAEIESIYNAAIQAVEIGALLRKQAEQDDEDDLLMLLA